MLRLSEATLRRAVDTVRAVTRAMTAKSGCATVRTPGFMPDDNPLSAVPWPTVGCCRWARAPEGRARQTGQRQLAGGGRHTDCALALSGRRHPPLVRLGISVVVETVGWNRDPTALVVEPSTTSIWIPPPGRLACGGSSGPGQFGIDPRAGW